MQSSPYPEENPNVGGLVEDLKSRLGASNLLRWIDDEGERLAHKGRTGDAYVDFTGPLLEDRRIRILRKDPKAKDARIRALANDGFEITYQEGLPPNRRRFSIAHEIGHTYFFRPGEGTIPLSPFQNRMGADPIIENLCDQFAASLLLPRSLSLNEFEKLSVSSNQTVPLQVLPKLARQFGVAERAVAIRLFFDLPLKLEAVICIRSRKVQQNLFKEREPQQQWQSSWLAVPKEITHRTWKNQTRIPLGGSGRIVPPDMIPALVSERTELFELDSRWWHGIRTHDSVNARIPFSKISKQANKSGLVSFVNGRIYIALIKDD